jgi:tetratricopeptide (TPR) repeat protein
LQRRRVEWNRRQAVPLLERPVAGLSGEERNRLRSLAASLHELGQIQSSLEQPACVRSYQESLELLEKIGESAAAATCAFNLGHVYKDLAALRDLAQAEHWYRRSLELRPKEDQQGRGGCEAQLGAVAWELFKEAMAAKQPSEAEAQVKAALQHYHQALALLPADAVNDLAAVHNQLGMIYKNIGQLEPALHHYQEAIRVYEDSGDHYHAALVRYNVALALLQAQRLPDALAYARAALRGYQHYGERAQQEIGKTQALIDHIEQAANS